MGWQEVHNNRSLLAASVDVINSFTINIDGAVGVKDPTRDGWIKEIIKRK